MKGQEQEQEQELEQEQEPQEKDWMTHQVEQGEKIEWEKECGKTDIMIGDSQVDQTERVWHM